MERFDEFLQVFTWYLCSRCTRGAPHHDPQDTSDGTGKHAHNGEILRHLQSVPVTSQRVFSAYTAYTAVYPPTNIQRSIAKYYNNPRHNSIPNDPQATAVHRIIQHRNSTWIRHGVELPERAEFDPTQPFPQPHTRHTVGEQVTGKRADLNRYAVDLETFPFQTCSKHELDHHSGAPWFYTAAYIPIETYTTHNGVFYRSRDRDHLYAHSNIPHSEWLWVFRKTDTRAVQPSVQREQQAHIKAAGLPWIPEARLHSLNKLLNLLTAYQAALAITASE